MTKTEIISNTYENGKRISMRRVTIDRSDDLLTLANIYRQIENLAARIAETTDEKQIEVLAAERNRLTQAAAEQQTIVDGYDSEN